MQKRITINSKNYNKSNIENKNIPNILNYIYYNNNPFYLYD